MTEPARTDLVFLSEGFDLKSIYAEAFARHAPWLTLLNPDEVPEPGAIRFAMAYDPAPDAFQRFANLDLLCAWGAGVDGLLLHPGLPAGLMIKRMTDPAQAQMMAAFAGYYVTGWQRRMFDYPAQQAAGLWREINATLPQEFPVGVLGYGKMGAAIGRGLAAMGFPVTALASRARDEDGVAILSGPQGLKTVISESAALINVLPLTPETTGLLNAETFALMREDAILIQLGRGEQLSEPDLLKALDAGRPALAALDVTATEPLPAGSPLWTHPKIMLTPHAASTASPGGVAMSVAEGIAARLRGAVPEGIVDRLRGY